MMKRLFFTLLIPILTIFGSPMCAQCPTTASVSLSAVSTPRTCGGNGTITATFSPGSEVALQLLKAGSIISQVTTPSPAASPYTWSALQPGNDYQVRIICNSNNSTIYQTVNVTVADHYVPITDATISVSNVCTSYATGGTFTISGVTGGNPTYQYSIIASDDPGYDDAFSTYSTSNVLNVTEFRTYQIRIKDACGAYATFTRSLQPALEPIRFYWRSKKMCAPDNPKQALMTSWYAFGDITGNSVDIGEYINPGIRMVIRDTNASGAILFNGIYSAGTTSYQESSSHIYHVTTTNACGLTATYFHNLNGPDNPEYNDFRVVAGNSGCGASERMSISASFVEQHYWRFPVTITVRDSGGNSVGSPITGLNFNDVANIPNLPFGTYTVTATDQCGESLSKTVTSPQGNGTPSISIYTYTKWRCGAVGALTQTGTIQVTLQIFGFLSDRANAMVKIVSGPSNVGVVATALEGQYWGWTNMRPGTYSISVMTCGVENFYPITIPPTTPLLEQSLISTSQSFCTSGGNINSTKVYTGAYPNIVELLDASGTVIASHVDGNFTNLPAGTYTTRLRINACDNTVTYLVPGNSVTISNSATGPSISASTGVICEDAAGNSLSSGSAYLDLAGVAPFTIEYRVKDSGVPFTVINTSNSSIQINGLIANNTYEIILKDSCGGNFPTTLQIKTMGALSSTNTDQPCANNPYTLTMPYYAGASYKWINPAGDIISTSRTHTISNFTSTDNGNYICEITWSSCVTRFSNLTLNSALCGGPTGLCGSTDSDGDGIFDGCDLDDDNDGILDTEECSNTIMDMFAMYASNNLIDILPADFGLVTGDKNRNVSRDLSHKFGYPVNSGAIIVNITNGSVHPDPATPVWWTKNGEQPSNWTITGTLSAFVLMAQDHNYYANDSKTFHIYDQAPVIPVTFPAAMANQTPVPNQWAVTETPTTKILTNLRSDNPTTPKQANWRYVNMNFGPKSFGFSTTVAQANPTYEVLMYLECDTDRDGIPNRLDLDSDNDGCVDAKEGGDNITDSQLQTAAGTVSVGVGSTALIQNLGIDVDDNGIPLMINGGQSVGDSQNASINACACYQPGTMSGNSEPTKHGITALGRSGADSGNWPMVRTGAWTVLEAKTKGFVLNRIETTALVEAIANPVIGMLVYDIEADCLKINTTGTASGWTCFKNQTCPN